MEKYNFKLTDGSVGEFSKEEIDMVLYFESRGFSVRNIQTEKNGKVVVTWSDGSQSEYLNFKTRDVVSCS